MESGNDERCSQRREFKVQKLKYWNSTSIGVLRYEYGYTHLWFIASSDPPPAFHSACRLLQLTNDVLVVPLGKIWLRSNLLLRLAVYRMVSHFSQQSRHKVGSHAIARGLPLRPRTSHTLHATDEVVVYSNWEHPLFRPQNCNDTPQIQRYETLRLCTPFHRYRRYCTLQRHRPFLCRFGILMHRDTARPRHGQELT